MGSSEISRSTLIYILVGTVAGCLLLLFFLPAGLRPVFAISAVVVLIPAQAAIAYSLAVVRRQNGPSGSDPARRFADSATSLGLRRWMAGAVELRAPLRLNGSYTIVAGAAVAWFVVVSVASAGLRFGWEHFNNTGAVVWGFILGSVWILTVLYLLVEIASGLYSCFAKRSAGSGLRDVLERLAMVAFLAAPAMPVAYCVYEPRHIRRGLSGPAAHYCLPPQAIEQAKDIGGVPLKGKLLLLLDEKVYEKVGNGYQFVQAGLVSDFQIYLPTAIRAETLDEVRAVGVMTERLEVEGRYVETPGGYDAGAATRVNCAVRLLIEPEHKQVWEGEFRGGDPSPNKDDGGGSGRGNSGCYDAIRFLSHLRWE